MARPKSENPRSVRLVVKLTADEKARLDGAAAAAGASVSEYVRGLALLPRGVEQASVGMSGRKGAGRPQPATVATSDPAAPAEPSWPDYQDAPEPERKLPDRRLPGLWWCARPLCQKRSLVKGDLCPTHGEPMTMKGE